MILPVVLFLAAAPTIGAITPKIVGCGCACGIMLEMPCGPCDCVRACHVDPCDPRVKAEGCGGCTESSSDSGSGGSVSAPSLALPPPRNMQEAMVQGVYQGLMNAMQAAPASIQRQANISAANSRALNAAQAQQGQATEQQLHEAAQRAQEEEALRSQQAGSLIRLPSRAPVAPADSDDGAVRLFGDTPMLLSGDPETACRKAEDGRRRSPLCLDAATDVPPPLGDSEDARRARAEGERLQGECDASHDQDSLAAMKDRLKEYVRTQSKNAGIEKAKDYIEARAKEIGLPVEEFKRAREGGGILSHYAAKTLNHINGEAHAAACALASNSSSCLDDFYAHDSAIDQEAKAFERDTHEFVAKQFGANEPTAKAAGNFLSTFQ